MGPDTIVKKALVWLGRRGKRVAQHIALHNSEQAVAAKTRPWILRKAMHSVTIGGDRVTKKICEKTLKGFDHYVAQENGRHAFTKLFGRQIGRRADQTAFRLIVDETGKIITGYAVTAAQAATSTAGILILDRYISETIGGLNRVDEEYAAAHPPREDTLVEQIIDFFLMSDLGDEPVGANEGLYLAEDRYRSIMEQQYISALEELKGTYLDAGELEDVRARFREGIAGAVAPYVEDEG
jgi:hypothetical protein